MAMKMSSSQHEMVHEQRPVMSTDVFLAAMKGDGDVLIPRLGLLEQQEVKVTIEASHSAPEQIKTEHQTVQSELRSVTHFEDTILHILVTKGHNELALMVFRRDVSLLKSPNKNLETPLHCAAKVGNGNVIDNLIQIDPVAVKDALEQKNENGDTALHVAATYDHIGISLALMKLDPEVAYRVNNNMFSALNVAIDKKYTKLVQTMLEQDHALAYTQFATGMFPVHLAASTSNKELVLHLMEKYPECAELLDPRGRNLFHVAAEKGMSKSFREIFKNTSVREMIARMYNAQDYEGNTPMHIAAMKGIRFSMEGIGINKINDAVVDTIENKEGLTPFQLFLRQLRGTNKNFKNGWERTQVVGLGAVLITTVAFTVAFTIPGGYNQDHGTPVLGRRYIFRAFILADALAFIQGSVSLFVLLSTAIYTTNEFRKAIRFATMSFFLAASSMIVAFGLGLYVTLAPVCFPIAVLILVITLLIGSPAGIFFIIMSQEPFRARSIIGYFDRMMTSILVSFLIIFCLAFL